MRAYWAEMCIRDSVDAGNALAPQAEGGAGLGARRQAPLHLAVDGGNLQLRPQRGLRKVTGCSR